MILQEPPVAKSIRVPDVPTEEGHRSRWMRFVPQRILRSFFR